MIVTHSVELRIAQVREWVRNIGSLLQTVCFSILIMMFLAVLSLVGLVVHEDIAIETTLFLRTLTHEHIESLHGALCLILHLEGYLWSSLKRLVLVQSCLLLLRLRSTVSILSIVNPPIALDDIVHILGIIHVIQEVQSRLVIGVHKAELHLWEGECWVLSVHKAAVILIEGVSVLDFLQFFYRKELPALSSTGLQLNIENVGWVESLRKHVCVDLVKGFWGFFFFMIVTWKIVIVGNIRGELLPFCVRLNQLLHICLWMRVLRWPSKVESDSCGGSWRGYLSLLNPAPSSLSFLHLSLPSSLLIGKGLAVYPFSPDLFSVLAEWSGLNSELNWEVLLVTRGAIRLRSGSTVGRHLLLMGHYLSVKSCLHESWLIWKLIQVVGKIERDSIIDLALLQRLRVFGSSLRILQVWFEWRRRNWFLQALVLQVLLSDNEILGRVRWFKSQLAIKILSFYLLIKGGSIIGRSVGIRNGWVCFHAQRVFWPGEQWIEDLDLICRGVLLILCFILAAHIKSYCLMNA